MYDERDFLEAIAADGPDDDTSCLLFADWLEERGDARGELVRIGVELERLPPWDPRRHTLGVEVTRLVPLVTEPWKAYFDDLPMQDLYLSRGVPFGVELSAHQCLHYGDEIFAAMPTLRFLRLDTNPRFRDDSDFLAELRELELWQHVEQLNLSRNQLIDKNLDDLPRLTPSPLKYLHVGLNQLSNAAAPRLLENPWAANATWELSHNRIGLDFAEAIEGASAAGLLAIAGLRLRGNRIGEHGLRPLARADLPQLSVLDLADNGLTSHSCRRLPHLESRLSNLESLDVRENRLRADGAEHLADAALMRSVTNLQIRNNGIGSEGLIALANSLCGSTLEVLNVAGNQLRDDCLDSLANCRQLRFLDLSDNLFGDAVVDFVLEFIDGSDLEFVSLEGQQFSSAAVRRLRARDDPRIFYASPTDSPG